MKKILIIGASGFLGTKMYKVLSDHFIVYGFDFSKAGEGHIDVRNDTEVNGLLLRLKPDVVINANGLSDVDKCELEQEKAFEVNVEGTKNVALACKKINAKYVFISTDSIFDGKNCDYTEEDEPSPLNYYDKTKLKAEENIKNILDNYIILRPGILYGYNDGASERGFVNWIYNSLKKGENIKVVKQIRTPVLIDDVVLAIIRLIQLDCKGTYHIAGPQKLSLYDMAIKFAIEFGFDQGLVNPTTFEELKLRAIKPLDSSLSTKKINKLGIFAHTFDEGLKIMKKQIEQK